MSPAHSVLGDSPDRCPAASFGRQRMYRRVSHSSVACTVSVRQISSCLHGADLTGDGPGETQKFACDRRNDERKWFALGGEASVASTKPDLRLPGYVTYFHRKPFKRLCCNLLASAREGRRSSERCDQAASSSSRLLTNRTSSARGQGPSPKARSTMRVSPQMSRVRLNAPAWPLRSARITSKPLIVA